MGMNIYLLEKDGGKHLGKRSANGIWCWDCRIRAKQDMVGDFLFCPKCGARCSGNTLSFNPVMRELGFDRSLPKKRLGINGASRWTWCIDKEYGLGKQFKKRLENIKKVRTEYGDYWSIKRFWKMFDDVIEVSESDGDFC